MSRESVVVALNPVSQPLKLDEGTLIRLDSLENKTVGFLSNNKPNADEEESPWEPLRTVLGFGVVSHIREYEECYQADQS
jgi:hypothetical protein